MVFTDVVHFIVRQAEGVAGVVVEDGVCAAVVAVEAVAGAEPEVAAGVLVDGYDGELGDSFVKFLAIVE